MKKEQKSYRTVYRDWYTTGIERKDNNYHLINEGIMADIVVCARNNINILQFIMDVSNVTELEKNTYLEQFINDEIAKPNDAEVSVYDEIEYNELVIACNGDMQLTEAIYTERQEKRRKELNLISEMIEWIYARNSEESVNGQVRKNMFTLTENLQKKAFEQYADHYRSRQKDTHPAVLGDYSTEINFTNREGERQKIISHYEAERDAQLSQIKLLIAIIGAIISACGIGLAIYMRNPFCLFLSVCGVVLITYNMISNKMRRKHIHKTCLLNIKSKNEIVDDLFSEYEMYKRELEEYDSYYEKVLKVFDEF